MPRSIHRHGTGNLKSHWQGPLEARRGRAGKTVTWVPTGGASARPRAGCQCQGAPSRHWHFDPPTASGGPPPALLPASHGKLTHRMVHGLGTAGVGLGGKGCTRMRPGPKLHLPVLGHAFRASGVMACSSFGRLSTLWHIRVDLFESSLVDPNPSIPRRQPKLPCDSHGLRLWPSNIPDLA